MAKPRNREQTKQLLIRAVIDLVSLSGFKDFGINSVAKKAGYDKVLIYRYFGDLDGLLRAVSESVEFFPQAKEFASAHSPTSLQAAYIDGLKQRPLTVQLLKWATAENNPLTQACLKVRDEFEKGIIPMISNGDDKTAALLLRGAVQQFLEGYQPLPLPANTYSLRQPAPAPRRKRAVPKPAPPPEPVPAYAYEEEDVDDPNSLPTKLL